MKEYNGFMPDAEPHNEVKSYRLGPLPWADDLITTEYFKSSLFIRETINEHPGHVIRTYLRV